jgi:hypothetical protein
LKLLDKSVNSLSQRLDKLYPDTNSNNSSNDGINYWKGRKIIPLDKWLKITKANTISRRENYNIKEGLQYFPDDYFEWMFSLGIPEDLKEEANKWYCDYIELMEYRRNPRIGRTKCFRCLLSPSREESAIFLGINKVIARAIEQENNSSSSTIYPCPILNRYQCPFDKKKSNENNNKINTEEKEDSNLLDVDDDLFNLSEIAFQVELAFATTYSMSKSNETIYETDFEAGKVKEIYANYRGDPYSFSAEYPLEEKLGKEVRRLSKVPIRNVQDVYNALTDRETLDKVLEQGLDDEEYQEHREELVNLFIGLKDKIKIEDLTLYEPIFTLNIQKSKCSICQDFANIHCINCSNNNFWLCIDHWKQHNMDKHTKISF